MDEKKPRDGDVEPRAWRAPDEDLHETAVRDPLPHDELSCRRHPFRDVLTDRERAERWPCG